MYKLNEWVVQLELGLEAEGETGSNFIGETTLCLYRPEIRILELLDFCAVGHYWEGLRQGQKNMREEADQNG